MTINSPCNIFVPADVSVLHRTRRHQGTTAENSLKTIYIPNNRFFVPADVSVLHRTRRHQGTTAENSLKTIYIPNNRIFIYMAVDKPLLFEPGIYFLTFTNYKWAPLFDITQSYDLVYKWFEILRSEGHHIIGYVIMPNHVHALIGFMPGKKNINTIIGNGKRFMAYDIVGRLKEKNRTDLLSTLAEGVTPSDRRRGKLHEVFEPSFDIKFCHSYKFINQKLAYMHNNPVSKKWMLTQYAGDYIHSSAGFYETGKQGVYEVMDRLECIDKYWHNEYPGVLENI